KDLSSTPPVSVTWQAVKSPPPSPPPPPPASVSSSSPHAAASIASASSAARALTPRRCIIPLVLPVESRWPRQPRVGTLVTFPSTTRGCATFRTRPGPFRHRSVTNRGRCVPSRGASRCDRWRPRGPGQGGGASAPGALTPPTEPFALAQRAAADLARATGVERHDVAVVLGSGWRPAADRMGEVVRELATTDLPGFPEATVPGHAAAVRSIEAPGGRRVLAFLGRVHGYEGHGPETVVHPGRTAHAAGCSVVVLTNAAGGIREGLAVGQPVLIADHLNLTGRSPVAGPMPATGLPPRFVDLTDAYSGRLRDLAR